MEFFGELLCDFCIIMQDGAALNGNLGFTI